MLLLLWNEWCKTSGCFQRRSCIVSEWCVRWRRSFFLAKHRVQNQSLPSVLGSGRDTAVFLIIHETVKNYNAADAPDTHLPHEPLEPLVGIQNLRLQNSISQTEYFKGHDVLQVSTSTDLAQIFILLDVFDDLLKRVLANCETRIKMLFGGGVSCQRRRRSRTNPLIA